MSKHPGRWLWATVLVWSSVLAAAGAPAERPAAPAPAQAWPLPVKADSLLLRLRPTADGRRVFLDEVREVEKGDEIESRDFTHLLDTQTGQWRDVSARFDKAVAAKTGRRVSSHPSPDGKHVLFVVAAEGRPPKRTAWLFTLADGKARKLAEGADLMPVWAGATLYVGCVGLTGKAPALGPIQVFDIAAGTSTELPICGAPAAADPAGKRIVCAVNPDALTQPLTRPTFQRKGAMVLLSPKGKLLQRLGSTYEIRTPPVVSPGGKLLAVRRRIAAADADKPRVYVIDVVTVGGGKRTISDESRPIAVTDAGHVVATRPAGFHGDRFRVLIWDTGGQSRTLVRDTHLAGVGGDTLFYVTGRTRLVLRKMSLAPTD